MRRFIAVLVGLVVGYFLWLACISALTFVIPPRHLVVAGVIVLAVMVSAAAALARHLSRGELKTISLAFWCAPIVPTLASIYSLIVLLN